MNKITGTKNQINFQRKAAGIILFLLAVTVLSAKVPGEEEKVISVVKQFFAVMASRSVKDAKKILIPQGFSFSVRQNGNNSALKISNFQEFIDSLPNLKENYKEIMFNPKVLIHDRIAVLWAPYKFYRDGKFSHSGVDAFSLIKTDEGWKIAGVIYTVERVETLRKKD